MTIDLAIADKVRQLRREGLRPSEHLVRTIRKAEAAAVSPLLALATDVELLHEEPPECFAPLHALRLLGELRPVEIIQPLLREFPVRLDYEDEELPEAWVDDVPQLVGHFGAPAVEPLWQIVDDESWDMAGRSVALSALTYATATDPALREEIVAGLRERLAGSEDKMFTSQLAGALANLGVREIYSEIMALYREGRIDQEVLPAAAARQLLLTGGLKRLECANHSLWERYDQHGPFPAEREA
jgi:hypothetical protein